jgi:7,8-dihydropterin-6-yl-methyl-4-(beta-D-ribofuranosyl)aminobenzene 5'-phosphate synthase
LGVGKKMNLKILYDNRANDEGEGGGNGFQADWGFSCWVEFSGKKILFDTGANGDILLSNMEKFNLNPKDLDLLFISHDHWDHTGGLDTILKSYNNSTMKVYILSSFSAETAEKIKNKVKEKKIRFDRN